MRHLVKDLNKMDIGDKASFNIQDGYNVYVMIMTYENYNNSRHGLIYRYFGGLALKNKVVLKYHLNQIG